MPNKANRPRRKHILSVGLVAKRIIRTKDVGKVGAGAHLKPKRNRSEDPNDNKPNSKAQKLQNKLTSSSSQSSSPNDKSKN